jgi:hypothetical protein
MPSSRGWRRVSLTIEIGTMPSAIAKHVGIWTEPERFIHAYERLGVIEEALTPAWRRRVAFAFLFPG